jgi:FSR family fosmidomycin resistance protein-like MFS transporter
MSPGPAASVSGRTQSGGPRTGVDRRAMAVLSAGHLFTDIGQGSIPALLPFLIVRDHLNYASASALILAATISSSVIQPLFGHVSDRRSLPWLMPLGPVLGGIGVGLVGIAPSYGLTFAAVVLSGVGVAAFHPEGSRFANYVSGARRSSGMSLFSVGGNIGFALGPALMTPLVLVFGLPGTLLVIVPTSLMGAVLVRELPRLKGFRADLAGGRVRRSESDDAWGPFALLGVVIALRSFVYFGFVTFIPLYYIHDLHTSRATGGAALTVMLAGGALGTLIGGRLADRFGRRSVLVGSMVALPPLIAGFLVCGVSAQPDRRRLGRDDRTLDRTRRRRSAAPGPAGRRARTALGVRIARRLPAARAGPVAGAAGAARQRGGCAGRDDQVPPA